jgi:hypothetical protein
VRGEGAALLAGACTLCVLCLGASAAPDDANYRVKCKATDPDGRELPVRYGNSNWGWNHFSQRHNIKKCPVVTIPMGDKVDAKTGNKLTYLGMATRSNGDYVQIKIIVQYHKKTEDGEYVAPGREVIGVITAYCMGVRGNKCPNWVNG